MRRSGRVNQLTAGEVPIRPLLSVFPSATRFCPARHTTGTHQLASGRSCTRTSRFLFSFISPPSPSPLLASSSSSSYPFRPRSARADREPTFLSSGFLNDRRALARLSSPMILIDASVLLVLDRYDSRRIVAKLVNSRMYVKIRKDKRNRISYISDLSSYIFGLSSYKFISALYF